MRIQERDEEIDPSATQLRKRFQAREDIKDVREMVVERLHQWSREAGDLPQNIMYYRDGVSESVSLDHVQLILGVNEL